MIVRSIVSQLDSVRVITASPLTRELAEFFDVLFHSLIFGGYVYADTLQSADLHSVLPIECTYKEIGSVRQPGKPDEHISDPGLCAVKRNIYFFRGSEDWYPAPLGYGF